MNTIENLTELLRKLPGIGPRQAKRFVYFLVGQDKAYLKKLLEGLATLSDDVVSCNRCFRFYSSPATTSSNKDAGEQICNICSNKDRDLTLLMIVSRDIDFENIEKSGTYQGTYFVLGGNVPIHAEKPEELVRLRELLARIESPEVEPPGAEGALKEIILALSATPEGDHTRDIVRDALRSHAEKDGIAVTELGRGLSTGVELEYSDEETLKNALRSRHK